MAKFKVGDKVVGNEKANRYGITNQGWVGYVVSVGDDRIDVWEKLGEGIDGGYTVDPACFDLIRPGKPEKVVIYRNGQEVIAKNTQTGKIAKATCSPEDEFDFGIGAKLALDRLFEAEKPPKKYFNGKVVCVESVYNWWTVGKIYDVVDGIITADDGDRYPRLNLGHEPYVDAEDVKHAGCVDGAKHNPQNTFIAIVE